MRRAAGARLRRHLRWGGECIFLGEALAGEIVGVAATASGDWLVRFADLELGLIDRKTKKLHRFATSRPGRREPAEPEEEQTGEPVTHVSGL